MAAEAASLARTWPVGRWTVTLTMPPRAPGGHQFASCEWLPKMPDRPLTAGEMHQYRVGRDRAVAELAQALGISALILEVGA
jgi:hypothetical protein